jgi:hypothetical protein
VRHMRNGSVEPFPAGVPSTTYFWDVGSDMAGSMTRLVRSAGRLLAWAFVAFVVDPSSAQAPTICGQPFDGDLAAFAERSRHLPHARASATSNHLEEIVVRVPRSSLNGSIWNFTTPSHPAHPSVFCLQILHKEDPGIVDAQLHCWAGKEPCERLAAEASAQEQWVREWLDHWRNKRVP